MGAGGADGLSPVARFSIALAVILGVAGITPAAGRTALFGRSVERDDPQFDPQVCDAFLRVGRDRLATVYDVAPHTCESAAAS